MDVDRGEDNADAIAAAFDRVLSLTQRTALFEIERRAKQKAPVDTGFLANSIFTKIAGKIYVNGADGAAPAAPPFRRFSARAKREVNRPAKVAKMTQSSAREGYGEVTVGAEYGIYPEMGIGENGARAQPYLVPAFDEVARLIPSLMDDLLKEAGLI